MKRRLKSLHKFQRIQPYRRFFRNLWRSLIRLLFVFYNTIREITFLVCLENVHQRLIVFFFLLFQWNVHLKKPIPHYVVGQTWKVLLTNLTGQLDKGKHLPLTLVPHLITHITTTSVINFLDSFRKFFLKYTFELEKKLSDRLPAHFSIFVLRIIIVIVFYWIGDVIFSR